MFKNFMRLGAGQRIVIFTLVFGGGLMIIVLLFLLLVRGSLNERGQALPLLQGIAVQQFAALPDDDAYPASIAVGADGAIYTASYASGTVWRIGLDGAVTEIPNTRAGLGGVAGIAVSADGALYVIDILSSDYRLSGGIVRRVTPDGTISDFANIMTEPFLLAADDAPAEATPETLEGFVSPDDLALDTAGRIYVTDRVRRQIWRFEADGTGGTAWWTASILSGVPEDASPEPTGITYDPQTDAIIVADAGMNAVYRIPVATGESEILYQYTGIEDQQPQFDGVAVGADGTVYVAALGRNRVGRLMNGTLEYLAGGFRGGSDLAYNPLDGRLYVTNFDSASLVAPAIYERRLPFALDVITFTVVAESTSD